MKSATPFKILLLLAALVVGLVYSLPHIIRERVLAAEGKRYFSWTAQGNFDMFNVHAGRYREIIDGRLVPGEIDTYEHRAAPVIWPLFSATVFAPILRLTDSVQTTVIVTDAIWPMLIFLCFFLLLRALTGSRYFSLWASFILLLFPQLPLLLPPSSLAELKHILFQLLPVLPSGNIVLDLTYWRREAFIPAAPFFILTFYFVHQALLARERGRTVWFAAGVFYGSLFYLYFYYWAFTTVFLAILCLWFFFTKRKQEALAAMFVGLIGLIVSVPFWINQYQLSSLPQYKELVARAGMEVGRAFRLALWKTYLLYGGLAGFAWWLGIKLKNNVSAVSLAALGIAEIIVLNIQIATGYNLQSDHWSGRVFLIIQGIVLAVFVYWVFVRWQKYLWLARHKKTMAIIAVALPLFILTNVVYSQIAVEKRDADKYTVPSALLSAYDWLDKNTPADSVVMTPALATNIDLPVFTHNRIFLARAQNTVAGGEEILNRLYFTYKFFNIAPAYLERLLDSQEGIMYFFSVQHESQALDRYLRPEKYGNYALPEAIKAEVLSDYQAFALPEEWRYRLDYVFIGPKERAIGLDAAVLRGYQKLYGQDGVEIYKRP